MKDSKIQKGVSQGLGWSGTRVDTKIAWEWETPLLPSSNSTVCGIVSAHDESGRGYTLPPLPASTFTESLGSLSQNAACHLGALESCRMTCNTLHLAIQTQPINSQAKADQGQCSVGHSTFQAVGFIQPSSWGFR